MTKVRHVLGISGGKDSAALAIYLSGKYKKADLPIEYYTCDTGNELDETYRLIEQIELELDTKVRTYVSQDFQNVNLESPFHLFWERYGRYLPSQNVRWCTKDMKLEPFEAEIADTPTISYVGIRGDEDREGYISTKPNIQSIFPFRKNIWSKDVISKVFSPLERVNILEIYGEGLSGDKFEKCQRLLEKKLDDEFTRTDLVDALLGVDIKAFNKAIFEMLKDTDYPVGKLDIFPLIDNDEVLVRNDIFNIIEESTFVDLPNYYKPIEYEVDGEKGQYFRSRSGCYFCFYQQKIEWVWLKEQHYELFERAKEFEVGGYSWIEGESLSDLEKPERIIAIKREHLSRMKRRYLSLEKPTDWQESLLGIDVEKTTLDKDWIDQLQNAEGDGCASCFI